MMFKQAVSKEQLAVRFPAIFAQSEKETLSDKYLYIPTFKLLEGLERTGFQIIGAKQARSRTNTAEHGKHVVYLAHGDVKALTSVGDELPMLALTNSHNGLSAFAIDTAFFRLVCSNGLMMPTNSVSSARITHKKGMEQDVIEAAYKVIKSFPEQVKQIETMKKLILNKDEQRFLAESAAALAYDEKVIADQAALASRDEYLGSVKDLPAKLLMVRRHADRASDLWTTFNVIQENVIKGGLKVWTLNEEGKATRGTRTRAVNSIDRDSKLNKELMALAQKMAELKGA